MGTALEGGEGGELDAGKTSRGGEGANVSYSRDMSRIAGRGWPRYFMIGIIKCP